MLDTPILFLVFNRPDSTAKVFEEIRKAKPKQLFIAADGPRLDKEGEYERCQLVRQITLQIDWDCEIKTLFREKNLGCRKAVSEGITWFFDHVEEGIILEDDCLPNDSFFVFCAVLLEKYKDNKSIMHIGGTNFQNGIVRGNGGFYFSSYIHIWGWATWRRAWKLYDIEVKDLHMIDFQKKLRKRFPNHIERDILNNVFNSVYNNLLDTWDIQWTYSILKNDGIGITPNVNLVSNIGYTNEATHTTTFDPKSAFLPTNKMLKLISPTEIIICKVADRYTFNSLYRHGDTDFRRLQIKMYKKFPVLKIIVNTAVRIILRRS